MSLISQITGIDYDINRSLPGMGGSYGNYTKEEAETTLKNLYAKYLKRAPAQSELDQWTSGMKTTDANGNTVYRIADMSKLNETFAGAASLESGKTYNTETGEATGTTAPADTMPEWEKNIRNYYEAAYPEIEAAVKSAASQRGGMETGGYLSSIAKGKATTWTDMLKAITTQQNVESAADKSYQVETAKLNASTPSTFSNILSGAAAGTSFGPWGAAIGGLAGWGASQGFFD